MCAYVYSFPVEDASGAQFQMHKFVCRRVFSRVTRYQVDTGEIAEALDDHVFAIIRTKERLLRV